MKTLLTLGVVLVCRFAMAIAGYVTADDGNGVIILREGSRWYAVTNYAGEATVDKRIAFNGKKVGVYRYGDTPMELWDAADYVAPSVPPQQVPYAGAARLPNTNASAKATNAIVLPAEVVRADSRLNGLLQRQYSLGSQISALRQKQYQRLAVRLAPDAGTAVQINNLIAQQNMLGPQILSAQQSAFQARERYHLPHSTPRQLLAP